MSYVKTSLSLLLAFILGLAVANGAKGSSYGLGWVAIILLYLGPAGVVASVIALVATMKSHFLPYAINSLLFFLVLWCTVLVSGLRGAF